MISSRDAHALRHISEQRTPGVHLTYCKQNSHAQQHSSKANTVTEANCSANWSKLRRQSSGNRQQAA